MARPKKVVDASIGVKWFSQEEGSDAARELLRQHIEEEVVIVVPQLFLYEVVNALRYKKINSDQLLRAIADLADFQLQSEFPTKEVLQRSSVLALKHDLSIYDAMYLSVAEKTQSPCITSDKKFLGSKHVSIRAL